jgi:hypothetical protein
VTRINSHHLDRHFALDEPEDARLTAWDLANQLIHHYFMLASLQGRQFATLLVFSERVRNNALYAISVGGLIDFVHRFALDTSSVTRMQSRWNAKKQDYDVWLD